MMIPTQPIGSIPRPPELLQGIQAFRAGKMSRGELDDLYDDAVRDTVERFEATGSPVITDGEQSKESFVTYPLQGLGNLAPDGVPITFAGSGGRCNTSIKSFGWGFEAQSLARPFIELARHSVEACLRVHRQI